MVAPYLWLGRDYPESPLLRVAPYLWLGRDSRCKMIVESAVPVSCTLSMVGAGLRELYPFLGLFPGLHLIYGWGGTMVRPFLESIRDFSCTLSMVVAGRQVIV